MAGMTDVLATAEREVTALTERYLAGIKAQMRRAVPQDEPGVYALLRYHLGWQAADGSPANEDAGKGLRPVLVLASCDLAGGNWRDALPTAAALELIHNFSLIHDDIQDQDEVRRGRATTWTVYGKHEAIAAGNAMRITADRALQSSSESGLAASVVAEASLELTRRYLEMIEGQYLDISFEESEEVTTEQYLDMVGRKTGALIEGAMFLGALIARGDAGVARAFGVCGRRLGLAFQIRDDYLGVWGDPAATGKPVGADIQRKKKSMPVVHMFQHAPPAHRAWLSQVYAQPEIGEGDVARVLELLDSLETDVFVQRLAEDQAQLAVEAIEGLGLAQSSKRTIGALADYFVNRPK